MGQALGLDSVGINRREVVNERVIQEYTIYRRTIGKRMAAKLKDIGEQLRKRMHETTEVTVEWLKTVVRGYFQYHAVPGNEQRLWVFRKDVLRLWLRTLRRRSQRSRWTWESFQERLGALIPEVEVLHPYPDVRFAERIQGRNRVR